MTAGAAGISINISANAAQASQALNNINVQINNINNTTNNAAASASSFGKIWGSLAAVGGFGVLASDILKINIAMETLRMQLKATTGSAEEATYAFDYITKFAKDTPFEIDGITKTFLTLQNYGIKPTTEVMTALTDEAAKLGGRQETLTGITLALGQAWGKGKLQGQEILQLVNQGVPVWDLLTQATGRSVAELQKMSEAGELGRDVLTKLIAKIGETSKGASAEAMDTIAGKISNLGDAWHTFEDALLQDKSEGLIKNILASFSNELNVLSRNMNNTIDNQIAHAEARIKTFNSMGAVGGFLGDLTGYDVNQEKNRVDALNNQKNKADHAHQALEAGKAAADAQKAADEAAAANHQAYWNVLVENANEADKAREAAAKKSQSSSEQSARQYAAERESIAKTIEQLQFELSIMTLSDDERKIQIDLRSRAANATASEAAQIENLLRKKQSEESAAIKQQADWDNAIKYANEYYDLRKEIDALADTQMTPDSMGAGLGKIHDSNVSQAEAKQLYDQLGKAYNEGFAKPAADETKLLSVFGEQAARDMQSNFANFLFDPFQKGLKGLGEAFLGTVQKMAADAAAAQVMESLFGGSSNGKGGFGSGGLLGAGMKAAGSGLSSLFGGGSSVIDQFGANASGRIMESSDSLFSGFFASGGDTPGGYRVVGEKGPELEATGPARIFNAQQTQAILGGGQNSGPGYTFSPTYNLNGNSGGNQQNIVALNEQINSAVTRIIVREQRAGGLLAS